MKKNLKKLDLDSFAGFSLTYSSLKSLYGGAHETKEHGGDFVDNNNNTHYKDCGPMSTGDVCQV